MRPEAHTIKLRRKMRPSALLLSGALALAMLVVSCSKPKVDNPAIYSCEEFTLYADSVVEGDYVARVADGTRFVSNYQSVDSSRLVDSMHVRFCINGRNNEMPHTMWHKVYVVPGDSTPVMIFGSTAADTLRRSASRIPRSALDRWTVRLDMRPILRSLGSRGYYVTPTADTIFREHFQGVWIAGDTHPFTDDVRTLRNSPQHQLFDHGDSTYMVTLSLKDRRPEVFATGEFGVDSVDRSMPVFTSQMPLTNTIYNIAAARVAATAAAMPKLPAMTTSATSYAVYESLALTSPELAKALLRRCVKGGKVVQDGAKGGSWPISADRLMWIVAANEVYRFTADTKWLEEAATIAANTLAADLYTLLDGRTRLLHGAYSNPYYGVRAYPAWMTPADLFASLSLRVNTEYYAALQAYREMLRQLDRSTDLPLAEAVDLADDINFTFWLPHRGFYSDMMYGRFYLTQSPATDNLAQALAVISGAAKYEMAQSLISRTPRCYYGVATNTPVAPAGSPYALANVVQPHVLAMWTMAAAQTENINALERAVGAFCRNFAFTRGVGFVDATTGRPLQHCREAAEAAMLGDAAGTALILRVLAGIKATPAGLQFAPAIPPSFGYYHRVEGLKYRNATIDLEIYGSGTNIHTATIDDNKMDNDIFPAHLEGHHTVKIVMANAKTHSNQVAFILPAQLPTTPVVHHDKSGRCDILNYNADMAYRLLVNGIYHQEIGSRTFSAETGHGFAEISLEAIGQGGEVSFISEPMTLSEQGALVVAAPQIAHPGTTLTGKTDRGDRYVELTPMHNLKLSMTVRVSRAGRWFVDALYANGSGQEDVQSRCVIRSVMVNGHHAGTIVMPCMGEGNWFAESYTNAVALNLERGNNIVTIECRRPYDLNSAGSPGTALIRKLRFIPMP